MSADCTACEGTSGGVHTCRPGGRGVEVAKNLLAALDRTQHWLDEFQGSASEQTLRAVRAEARAARLERALLAAHNAFDDLIQPICRYTDMDDPPPALAAIEARDACEAALATAGEEGD